MILAADGGSELFQAEVRRALRASMRLVNRARAAGAIRPDFDHSDLLMLQHANAGLIRGTQQSAPDAWRRLADYMLQAFEGEIGTLAPPPQEWARQASRQRDEE